MHFLAKFPIDECVTSTIFILFLTKWMELLVFMKIAFSTDKILRFIFCGKFFLVSYE